MDLSDHIRQGFEYNKEKRYFNSNRRKSHSDTNHDGIHIFKDYNFF